MWKFFTSSGAEKKTDVLVGYGVSLPTSPFNGQEYILVDSLTAPTYQWRFRYNTNSVSVYKWEFVGGAPLSVKGGAYTLTTAFVLHPGCSIVIPRAGVYQIDFKSSYWNGTGSDASSGAIFVNGVQQGDVGADKITGYLNSIWGRFTAAHTLPALTIATAGHVLELREKTDSGPTGGPSSERASVIVTPLRVA